MCHSTSSDKPATIITLSHGALIGIRDLLRKGIKDDSLSTITLTNHLSQEEGEKFGIYYLLFLNLSALTPPLMVQSTNLTQCMLLVGAGPVALSAAKKPERSE
jgi:hypothetical protein